MKARTLYLALLVSTIAAAAQAQDAPDLLGEWVFTGTDHPAGGRCGEVMLAGQLLITKKITLRAYRGKFSVRESTAKCRNVLSRSSGLTVRIKGDKVSIEYDNDGWESEALVLTDLVMSGKRSNGVNTTWVKQGSVQGAVTITLDEEEELAALFRTLEPEFANELRRTLGGRIRAAIEKTGVNAKDARRMSDQTLDRMAACTTASLQKQVRAEPDLLARVLMGGRNTPAINPRSVDYANIECIQAAALNVGVVIR